MPTITIAVAATVGLATIPLAQSSASDNLIASAKPTIQTGLVSAVTTTTYPIPTSDQQPASVELAPIPLEVVNSELLAAANLALSSADEAATQMEQVSPNLRRKIAKTSAVIFNLTQQLAADNDLVAPQIAEPSNLFTIEDIESSVTDALAKVDEIIGVEPAIGFYTDGLTAVRIVLAAKTDELAEYLNTATEIQTGIAEGNRIIEGTRVFSHTGVLLLKQFEGLSLTGYELGDGMCTIGYGIAIPTEQKPDCDQWVITEAQAETMLAEEVQTYANAVAEHFTRPLTQNQFDALTIFTYNVGTGIYQRYKWSPEPENQRITDAMSLYVNPPQFREGLTIRRNAEIALFNS